MIATAHCRWCGRTSDECDASCQRPLDPPRFCGDCGRRVRVQVTPTGYEARCREHGVVTAGSARRVSGLREAPRDEQ